MHKLYCFGFNVFGQAGSETEAILSSACIHKDIKTVLYAGWEVTIGIGCMHTFSYLNVERKLT